MDVIRAWKDPEYRRSLNSEEFAKLTAHPAGAVRLDDDALEVVAGGTTGPPCLTATTTTVPISIAWCSPAGTFCGTCQFGTQGCC
jgi:mersacidin/lichenicidin family type 2 lantibiotic